MAFPLAWALKDGSDDIRAFLLSVLTGLAMAAVLHIAGRSSSKDELGTREAIAGVAFAWVVASLQGCMPYMLGGYIPAFTDAYFEAMSGFTTTGATVLQNVEDCRPRNRDAAALRRQHDTALQGRKPRPQP